MNAWWRKRASQAFLKRPGPKILFAAVLGLVAVGSLFAIRRLHGAVTYLDALSASDAAAITLALVLVAVTCIIFALTWSWLLARLSGDSQGADWYRDLRAFAYCWLVRYIPATVPYMGSRVLFLGRQGVPSSRVAASLAYESILQLAAGAVLSLGGLLVAAGVSRGDAPAYLMAPALVLPLPFLLHPSILDRASSWALARAGRTPIPHGSFLPLPAAARVFAAYCLGSILNGLGFFLIAGAVLGFGRVGVIEAVAVFNLAGVVGVLAVFAPSGLGVREAAIVALLSHAVTPEAALAVAVVARVVAVAADLVFVALVALIDLGRHAIDRPSRRRAGPESAAAPAQTRRAA